MLRKKLFGQCCSITHVYLYKWKNGKICNKILNLLGKFKLRVRYIDTALLVFFFSQKVIKLWHNEKIFYLIGMHISIFKTYHDEIVIFHFCIFWEEFCFVQNKNSFCMWNNSISNHKQNRFHYWTNKCNLELYRHMNITSWLLILYLTFYHFYNWIHEPIIFVIFVYDWRVYMFASQP